MMLLLVTGCYCFIGKTNLFFNSAEILNDQLLVLSYSEPDEIFVEAEIINYLEERGFRICYHQRDFMPGTNIAENIADATVHSRRMIFILSR